MVSRRWARARAARWAIGASLGGALAASTDVQAAPRIQAFECRIGDGRGVLPRVEEEQSDDELICRVSLAGLRGRSPRDLVAELRIVPGVGPFRVVASAAFEAAGGRDRARVRELVVPHGTWMPAVTWSPTETGRSRASRATRSASKAQARGRLDRRWPRLRVDLCVRDRPAPGQTLWRLVGCKRLEIPRADRRSRRGRLERLFRSMTAG